MPSSISLRYISLACFADFYSTTTQCQARFRFATSRSRASHYKNKRVHFRKNEERAPSLFRKRPPLFLHCSFIPRTSSPHMLVWARLHRRRSSQVCRSVHGVHPSLLSPNLCSKMPVLLHLLSRMPLLLSPSMR